LCKHNTFAQTAQCEFILLPGKAVRPQKQIHASKWFFDFPYYFCYTEFASHLVLLIVAHSKDGSAKMAVITISRELGSGGDEVADLLCQTLGYCRMDKTLLSQIAEEAGVDVEAVLAKERSVTHKARLVSGAMRSLYSKDPSAFERQDALDDQTYARIVRETMEQYAQEGDAVIVGRGGQMILQDCPDALHVHLYASIEVRARRLVERLGISEAEAKRRIERSDEQKRQYIRHLRQNANWKNLKYYHLAIDTGRILPQVAAQMITLAAQPDSDIDL
jgi:cytidylate kinase